VTEAPDTRAGSEIWTLAEQEGGRLRPISYELLAWGRRLTARAGSRQAAGGGPAPLLCSVVLGRRVDRSDVRQLLARGADRVYLMESPNLEHFLVEPYAAALEYLLRQRRPGIVIAGATTAGRTVMPYVAVRMTTGLTADCTGLDLDDETGNLVQTRPAIGGNILATIVTARHRPQMATVRPRSARPPEPIEGHTGEVLEVSMPAELLQSRVEWLGFHPVEEDDANIQDADKVVSGGRGLKKAENFALVRQLAQALGAAVGASRDAVDRGWISYPHQVGLSGKTVTPRLYVAVGISGAIQHLAGMKTADTIVAINSDPDAQIFQVADFGVVGDLFEFLPALVEEIKRRKRTGGKA
jgi:electron transfer flavoprotein alpha subunit